MPPRATKRITWKRPASSWVGWKTAVTGVPGGIGETGLSAGDVRSSPALAPVSAVRSPPGDSGFRSSMGVVGELSGGIMPQRITDCPGGCGGEHESKRGEADEFVLVLARPPNVHSHDVHWGFA